MARNELKTLTSLRGVAALLVAAFHVPGLFGVRALAPHAYLAVDFFFVLSGFVLTHAYGERIAGGEMRFGAFVQARLARLYPLYAIATLAGAALLALRVLAHTAAWDARTLLALPLTLGFVPVGVSAGNPLGAIYPFEVQGWSLLWELVLGFGLFAWLKTGLRGLEVVVAGALALVLTVSWSRATLDGGWRSDDLWIGAVRAVFGFAAGAFVRRMLGALAPYGRVLGWMALAVGIAALIYALAIPAANLTTELALVVLGFPILVAGAALTSRRWLEGGVFDATGQASYSIYLLHGPLGLATGMVLSHVHGLERSVDLHLFGPAWMVGLAAVSWLSWRHIEEPARRAWSAHAFRRKAFSVSRPPRRRAGLGLTPPSGQTTSAA